MTETPQRADGDRIPCAVCGSMDTQPVYTKFGYVIGRCTRCGLIYANPRAPMATILARYSPDYFWKEYLPALGVHDGVFSLADFDARYAELLKLMAERTKGRRLLEVGCASGFFLKAAERAGWTVAGIELSEEAANFARSRLGLSVVSQPAEVAPFPEGSFDAAAMFEVIEHLFDPRSVLTAVARALVPGGTLVISTPNFDAAARLVLGVDWAVLSPLEHVYYFREDSLRQLLEATGFPDVQFVRTHASWGPMETLNAHHTHAPGNWRARATEAVVRGGGLPLARMLQRAGVQDTLLCVARRAG
jgi:SAM-dependent methyltransferase